MDILWFNTVWMSWNVFLALTAVIFGIGIYHFNSKPLKWFSGFMWLLFIPNTIYLYTDIIHLPKQFWQVDGIEKIILVAQYSLLLLIGAVTFFISFRFFDKALFPKNRNDNRLALLVGVNFVIGFGMVLGRIHRTNSWEVFTNVYKVYQDAIQTISSVELILLAVFFGLLCNWTYFSLQKLKILK